MRIALMPSRTPVVLALSSYESVQWLLQTNGRPIAAILLSGYLPSTVIGAEGVPTLRIGSGYAYKLDSPGYQQLLQDIARYVPNRVDSFQGAYAGNDFSIPNR